MVLFFGTPPLTSWLSFRKNLVRLVCNNEVKNKRKKKGEKRKFEAASLVQEPAVCPYSFVFEQAYPMLFKMSGGSTYLGQKLRKIKTVKTLQLDFVYIFISNKLDVYLNVIDGDCTNYIDRNLPLSQANLHDIHIYIYIYIYTFQMAMCLIRIL